LESQAIVVDNIFPSKFQGTAEQNSICTFFVNLLLLLIMTTFKQWFGKFFSTGYLPNTNNLKLLKFVFF
ncbi:MAG: hypothetical protein D3904_18200, partial [Candidatus Electrothrix sp. EH2]|nr:hypothetical protein [Candidatus Electrothrix sp. EH2]